MRLLIDLLSKNGMSKDPETQLELDPVMSIVAAGTCLTSILPSERARSSFYKLERKKISL